jgi:hypothetical protein
VHSGEKIVSISGGVPAVSSFMQFSVKLDTTVRLKSNIVHVIDGLKYGLNSRLEA